MSGPVGPSDQLDVQVDAGPFSDAPVGTIEAAVRAVFRLEAEGVEGGEISVALLDDEAIRALNREYLGHDRPTDVIAFALWDEGEPVVGDVYLGWEQAGRQAAEAGVSLEEEGARLAVHGTLHVLGWDHPDEADARAESAMVRRQEEIVARVMQPLRG